MIQLNWKKIGCAILFPPTWIKLIIAMLALASFMIITAETNDVVKNIMCSMVIMYCSIVLIATSVSQIKHKHKLIKNQLYKNKYTKTYLTNVFTNTKIDLDIAVSFNVLFIAFNFISAILYKSNWFGLFAIYYSLIGLIRFLILSHIKESKSKQNKISELKCARLCSYMLLAFNIILSCAIFMISKYHEGFKYNGWFLYVLSGTVIAVVVVDVINVLKYRNHKCPLIYVSQGIKLTSAMFSLLCLETALVAQFGIKMLSEHQSFLLALSGLIVSGIVILISLYTIIKCTNKLKKYKPDSH